jgi:hypothetical protein
VSNLGQGHPDRLPAARGAPRKEPRSLTGSGKQSGIPDGDPLGRSSACVLLHILILVLAGCLILAAASGCGSTAAEAGLRVFPFPDTPDASPQSEVGFLSLSPSDLRSVTVEGSRSGRHSGRIEALPNGTGASFIPEVPFTPGERVSVRAELVSETAGLAAGGEGKKAIAFAFTVATTPASSTTTTTSAPAGGSQPAELPPTWSFRSRPDLHPPVVTVATPDADPESGRVFVDAQFAPQNGPMILDSRGNVVWFLGLPAGAWAVDVKVQTYQGRPVLTWWQGQVDSTGHGSGEAVIADDSYRTVATVHAGAGYQADLHEFLITPRGTAWITVFQTVQADLRSVGGPREGPVVDSVVQEIDIQTGRVLWEWHALKHVPLTASYANKPTAGSAYDYFHINSIQETPDGDLIVSARNTWAVYRIKRSTGKIAWQLGGKSGSFGLGPGAQFAWQHDARLQPDGTLTLFDDGASPKAEVESRGLRLQLDTSKMTATLLSAYTHTPPLLAGSQGNLQLLPNGNWFVGWGDQPNLSEFASDGRLVFDAKFPGAVQSYRAYRFAWTGKPAEPPTFSAITGAGDQITVDVSWNGATDVASWELLAGPSLEKLAPVTSVPATGFETRISAMTSQPYLSVRALDAKGQVLGTANRHR